MNKLLDLAQEKLLLLGPNVIAALLILLIGWFLARFCRMFLRRLLSHTHLDPSLCGFTASLSYVLVLIVFLVAALSQLGIQTTSLIAMLGAVGFAAGLALQSSLSNFSAGLFIVLFRPFKLGDFIEAAGISGTVKQIDLFATVLSSVDNIQITIPNSKLYDDIIRNYSANKVRRIELKIGIGYKDSITLASKIILDVIEGSETLLKKPEPLVAVEELGDSSINLLVRTWAKTEDYWSSRYKLLEDIKIALEQEKIEMPFPQRTVHLNKV